MDDENLVKALRNCASAEGTCAECSYKSRVFPGTCNGCKWDMMCDAAVAIERLQAQVEELTDKVFTHSSAAMENLKEVDRLSRENKELKMKIDDQDKMKIQELNKEIERLKGICGIYGKAD